MPAYSYEALMASDRKWRINLINSLIGPKNLHVLLTSHAEHRLNAAIFNSGLHVGSSPPYVGFLLRPTTVPRHTYANLQSYPYATLNAVSRSFYDRAHETHAKFAEGINEADAVGLPLRWEEGNDLPYLAESPLTARLRLVEEHFLAVNQTRLLIFSIEAVWIAQEAEPDGFIRLDRLGLVAGSGCDAYWGLEFLERRPLRRTV